jgi:hypothetical protein
VTVTLAPCIQGDKGETRVLTMGGVSNLDAATSARCLLAKGSTVAELDCTIDDAESTATIDLGSAVDDWLPDGPEVGTWEGQIEVTFADGSILTWPTQTGSSGRFQLVVYRQFEPAA